MNINISDLEQFCAIVEEPNLRKVSEKHFISQPALSQKLTKLEDEFGVKLFIRNNRTLEITEYGELLYSCARKVMGELEKCKNDIQKIKGESDILSIAGDNMYFYAFIMPLFLSAHSNMEFVRSHFDEDTTMQALLDNACDLVVSAHRLSEEDPGIESVFIMEYQLYVSATAEYPFFHDKEIAFRELDGLSFVRTDLDTYETKTLDKFLTRNNINLNVKYQSGRDSLTIFKRNSNLLVFTTSYNLLINDQYEGRRYIHISDYPLNGYPLYLSYRKSSSKLPLITELLIWIKKMMKETELQNPEFKNIRHI
ncbi:MAG: LysR family transcriptional regulator [Oscillospiraceae bacterium]|nr:LysR family transcriptional regulator [Oscillospiraceae bacterium]